LRQIKDQFWLERAFNMDVQFGLWHPFNNVAELVCEHRVSPADSG
jgi:hypothetical protein